jgi:hypothetical protein
MFRGDDDGLDRVLRRAFESARELGHPRIGSEHLLLALAHSGGAVARILAGHGASVAATREAVCAVAPAPSWPRSVSRWTACWTPPDRRRWTAPPAAAPCFRCTPAGPVDGARE